MDRILFRMWRIWRNPPSKPKLIVMMVALALSFGLILVERYVGWPSWMHTGAFHMRHLPRL